MKSPLTPGVFCRTLLFLVAALFFLRFLANQSATRVHAQIEHSTNSATTLVVHPNYRRDTSNELRSMALFSDLDDGHLESERPVVALAPDGLNSGQRPTPTPTPHMTPVTPESAAVEQTSQGTKPSAEVVASFDGLGYGFQGPQ